MTAPATAAATPITSNTRSARSRRSTVNSLVPVYAAPPPVRATDSTAR